MPRLGIELQSLGIARQSGRAGTVVCNEWSRPPATETGLQGFLSAGKFWHVRGNFILVENSWVTV